MKVYFDNVTWEAEHLGPNCFAKRLAIEFGNMGITVADANDYDIALAFISSTPVLDKRKPFVQRLDGLWIGPGEAPRNVTLKNTYAAADHVIWQSNFSKKLSTAWFGDKQGTVINNGIPTDKVEVRSETFLEMREKYDKIFCCSAHWHSQKRLGDTIEAFRLLLDRHPNSCLIVMGSNSFKSNDRRIYTTDNIRADLCLEVYAISDWMLHFCYLDNSPNTVVEALSQGCPVICSSEGGTKEIVEACGGHVVEEEAKYDFNIFDYDSPPKFPIDKIPSLDVRPIVDNTIIDIKNVAKRYARVLEDVLKAKR